MGLRIPVVSSIKVILMYMEILPKQHLSRLKSADILLNVSQIIPKFKTLMFLKGQPDNSII